MIQPPVFLFAACLACIFIFSTILTNLLPEYQRSEHRDSLPLVAPFLGFVIASIVFVASGLQTIGFYGWSGYLVATFFVGLLAGIIWLNFKREYT